MTEPVSLPEIKRHLRLDESDTAEDEDLGSMIIAARRTVELYIGQPVVAATVLTADDITVVNRAMKLIVGRWYLNREADGTIPRSATWLLDPIRKFDDGCDEAA